MSNYKQFEIKEMLGQLGIAKANGWAKELNVVTWYGKPPKYDIREWSPDHENMSRGITLTWDELRDLGFIVDRLLEKESVGE